MKPHIVMIIIFAFITLFSDPSTVHAHRRGLRYHRPVGFIWLPSCAMDCNRHRHCRTGSKVRECRRSLRML